MYVSNVVQSGEFCLAMSLQNMGYTSCCLIVKTYLFLVYNNLSNMQFMWISILM